MQTAKNAFLFPHRTYVRKAFEAYFTKLIELMWGKKRIMEVYLNIIEFGDGIYGCEAAAQHYFNKSAKELTKTEAAQLAVSLPNPRKFNPDNRTQYFNKRVRTIKARMYKVDLSKKTKPKK
jgi:monofunctional biosynthetic peptidoglycan transglycosylase